MYTLPGKIYLMNAGSGPAGSLTGRAVELLKQADLVLHDSQVAPEALDVIPARTAVHSAGEPNGQKSAAQEAINKKMIDAARHGQTVIFLKGDGASVLDNVQAEIETLREAHIEFEIVPAVSAARA